MTAMTSRIFMGRCVRVTGGLCVWAFDLLHLNGLDLRSRLLHRSRSGTLRMVKFAASNLISAPLFSLQENRSLR